MQRAVSCKAKWRPVPTDPHSRITLRAAGPSTPITKGRRMARTTPSTKGSCPRTVFFTSSASPSKLPAGAGAGPVCQGESSPSSSISCNIWRLLARASAAAVSCRRICSLWRRSCSSSRLCWSSSTAFNSAKPPDCFGGVSGSDFGRERSFPPGPNTPFIKLSQSSVYAMLEPPCICLL